MSFAAVVEDGGASGATVAGGSVADGCGGEVIRNDKKLKPPGQLLLSPALVRAAVTVSSSELSSASGVGASAQAEHSTVHAPQATAAAATSRQADRTDVVAVVGGEVGTSAGAAPNVASGGSFGDEAAVSASTSLPEPVAAAVAAAAAGGGGADVAGVHGGGAAAESDDDELPATVVNPDSFLFDDRGKYVWSPERVKAAWAQARQEWDFCMELRPRKAVLMVGAPASGKSTWVARNKAPNMAFFDATFDSAQKRVRASCIVHRVSYVVHRARRAPCVVRSSSCVVRRASCVVRRASCVARRA